MPHPYPEGKIENLINGGKKWRGVNVFYLSHKAWQAPTEANVLSHPNSELSNVDSLLQGGGGLFFSHLGDEVLGVVGRLCLHGRPDCSGHATRLSRRSSWWVVDHSQSDVVAGFLSQRERVLGKHSSLLWEQNNKTADPLVTKIKMKWTPNATSHFYFDFGIFWSRCCFFLMTPTIHLQCHSLICILQSAR